MEKKTVEQYVMYFSYQERKKREMESYKKELHRLKDLDKDELDLEYIDVLVEYEHRKNILTVFILTVVIAMLLYMFVQSLIEYVGTQSGASETAEVFFFILLVSALFITVVILIILFSHVKRMKDLYRRRLVIETVRFP
ncbi:MAG TPA: hypothetical protein H9909_03205 [Candidatus Mediterraneibacter norfolkensis]|nr:hypothetical protein [Candidatus Mediterraneibacter norfolkensis]